MTYEECAAAGMTQAETARAMGRSKSAVSVAAKRLGLTFAGRSPSPETIEKIRAANLGPLTALTEAELDDYRFLRRTGYRRAEALAAMGRMDLIGGDA